jgi:hypothetical protein
LRRRKAFLLARMASKWAGARMLCRLKLVQGVAVCFDFGRALPGAWIETCSKLGYRRVLDASFADVD